ncbi:MAG TPA: single-stranded DNA-binding protein [Moraxellaceae bacterium]|nr:single-stranded DNA-binding protein [Moraxellaceae bacterium]
MKSLNTCTFIGRLGKDPEIRYTANGDAVCNFSLALSDDYKDTKNTYWPRFSVFGKQAEILGEYAKKGDKLAVTAKYTERKYTKDGQERTAIEFRVSDFELLGSKGEAKPDRVREAAPAAESFSDDIPF